MARAPAVLQASNQTEIYAPSAAKVVQVLIQPGQQVARGEPLFLLESPDLLYRLDHMTRNILLLRWRLSVQAMDNDDLAHEQVLHQELSAMRTEQRMLWDQQRELKILAPFSGIVMDLATDVAPGDWVAQDERLLTVIDGEHSLVKGYVEEGDLGRIVVGSEGVFYASDPDVPPLPGRILRVDQSPTRYLQEPYLASLYGGMLPVREQADGKLVVEGSVYRADLSLDHGFAVGRIRHGVMIVKTQPENGVFQSWRRWTNAIF